MSGASSKIIRIHVHVSFCVRNVSFMMLEILVVVGCCKNCSDVMKNIAQSHMTQIMTLPNLAVYMLAVMITRILCCLQIAF